MDLIIKQKSTYKFAWQQLNQQNRTINKRLEFRLEETFGKLLHRDTVAQVTVNFPISISLPTAIGNAHDFVDKLLKRSNMDGNLDSIDSVASVRCAHVS